jgi:hypothetical protein
MGVLLRLGQLFLLPTYDPDRAGVPRMFKDVAVAHERVCDPNRA